MSTEPMKAARNRAFANPAAARKMARDVKKQAELRMRIRDVMRHHPETKSLAFDAIDQVTDAIIEELKK